MPLSIFIQFIAVSLLYLVLWGALGAVSAHLIPGNGGLIIMGICFLISICTFYLGRVSGKYKKI